MNRRSIVRIAAALAFAFAAPATFAHAQLEKATPPVGGTVTSPAEIRLKFSDGVEPRSRFNLAHFAHTPDGLGIVDAILFGSLIDDRSKSNTLMFCRRRVWTGQENDRGV